MSTRGALEIEEHKNQDHKSINGLIKIPLPEYETDGSAGLDLKGLPR